MKHRANWPQLKAWLNKPGLAYSCVERGSGLYLNCESLEELHITLMSSPSIRADYKKAFESLEMFSGRGVIAVDRMAAQRLSNKMRKAKRVGSTKGLRLYKDGHGGIVIVGDELEIDVDAMLGDYSKWLENKANELDRARPSGDDTGGNVPPVSGGDDVPGEVQGTERSEDAGVQSEDGRSGPSNESSNS